MSRGKRRRATGGSDEASLLRVDLGDVVDADQEPRAPEHAGPGLERFGFVCRFSVADPAALTNLSSWSRNRTRRRTTRPAQATTAAGSAAADRHPPINAVGGVHVAAPGGTKFVMKNARRAPIL